MRRKLYKIFSLSLAFCIVFSGSVLAADKEGTKILIEYEDVKEYVMKKNPQIKLTNINIGDMTSTLYDIRSSNRNDRDSDSGITQLEMTLIELTRSEDSQIAALAQAALMNLQMSSSMMSSSNDNAEESLRDQIRIAELGGEHAGKNIVNSAQSMFVLYHQLSENIKSLEIKIDSLKDQIEINKYRFNYGLISASQLSELESRMIELDVNYNNRMQQRDTLVLEFKGLIGLKYEDEVEFGDVPNADRSYISKIDFDKDLKKVLGSSMSIKTKKAELSSKSARKKTKEYELQAKESEITANFKRQYQLLNEKLNALRISESSLSSLNNKLFTAEVSYQMGIISKVDFDLAKNEAESQKSIVKTNEMALFMEIESYKAMIKGMI